MPDSFGFDTLPYWGRVIHRCTECEWPGWGVTVPEKERERHQRAHAKQSAKELERQRKANLALARKAKKEYRQEGDS